MVTTEASCGHALHRVGCHCDLPLSIADQRVSFESYKTLAMANRVIYCEECHHKTDALINIVGGLYCSKCQGWYSASAVYGG